MLEASQPWSLFGFDIRRGLHYFRAGWRDFLWDDASVVLGAIDEVVAAHQATGEVRYFKAGKLVQAPRCPRRCGSPGYRAAGSSGFVQDTAGACRSGGRP